MFIHFTISCPGSVAPGEALSSQILGHARFSLHLKHIAALTLQVFETFVLLCLLDC